MKRGHFLKSLGGLSLLPFVPKLHAHTPPGGGSNCILVPSETAGPFPLDLTANEYFFRQDIREDRVGVQMRQKVRVIGAGNCQPCLLYTSPSPRDRTRSRMPSSA